VLVVDEESKLLNRGFIVLFLCNLLLFMNMQLILPTLPVYLKETFHANDFFASLSTTTFSVSAIAARIFSAKSLQKGQTALVLFLGLGIAVLSTAGYYWCGTLFLILLLRTTFGVGFGMVSTTFPTIVSRVLPMRRMGEGMGYFGLSTSVALSIGPMIGLSLMKQFSYTYIIVGAVTALILIFPLVLSVKEYAFGTGKTVKSGPAKWFDRRLVLPGVLLLLLTSVQGCMLSFMAIYGKEIQLSHVEYFFLFSPVTMILVRPIYGMLFDRKGEAAGLISGAVFMMISLFLLSNSPGMTEFVFSAIAHGVGIGALYSTIQAWMIRIVTQKESATANSMFLNSLDFGIGFGSMTLGMVAARAGYVTMYHVCILFMAAFLAIFLSSLWIARGKKRNSEMV